MKAAVSVEDGDPQLIRRAVDSWGFYHLQRLRTDGSLFLDLRPTNNRQTSLTLEARKTMDMKNDWQSPPGNLDLMLREMLTEAQFGALL